MGATLQSHVRSIFCLSSLTIALPLSVQRPAPSPLQLQLPPTPIPPPPIPPTFGTLPFPFQLLCYPAYCVSPKHFPDSPPCYFFTGCVPPSSHATPLPCPQSIPLHPSAPLSLFLSNVSHSRKRQTKHSPAAMQAQHIFSLSLSSGRLLPSHFLLLPLVLTAWLPMVLATD